MHSLIDASFQVNQELAARHHWAAEARLAHQAVALRTEPAQPGWGSLLQASLALLRAMVVGSGSWDLPEA